MASRKGNFLDERLPARFWNKCIPEPNSGCWLWLGTKGDRMGHGRAWKIGGGTESAHRVSYSALVGPIPDGLVLDHLCRTPCCVNPDHLEPVTQGENARRGIRNTKQHCAHGHMLTPENTYIFRRGFGQRRCRECHRLQMLRLRARRRNGNIGKAA